MARRSPLAVETGRRLRQLRTARGVSLSRLAADSGVGKGTLSELESGQRNPTLQTLFAVTTALGVSFSAILPPGEAAAADHALAPIEGDAIAAVLVDRFVDHDAVTELYRTTVHAGHRQESAPHAAGVTEHWIVYAGVLELGPADALLHLRPGESGTFTADVPHVYAAAAGEDVAATLLVRHPR